MPLQRKIIFFHFDILRQNMTCDRVVLEIDYGVVFVEKCRAPCFRREAVREISRGQRPRYPSQKIRLRPAERRM